MSTVEHASPSRPSGPLPAVVAPSAGVVVAGAPADVGDAAHTGARLGRALLGVMVAAVVVITLKPFAFAWPPHLHVETTWVPRDLLANVALFIPLGFLHAFARAAARGGAPSHLWREVAHATALGVVASSAIEAAQLFLPTRLAAPADVLANTVGAALGAWAHVALARRWAAPPAAAARSARPGAPAGAPTTAPAAANARRLGLELPLLGLVYLLLPLCALAAMATAERDAYAAVAMPFGMSPREWGLVALAAFGGSVLGEVQGSRFGPARALTQPAAGALAASWFMVGTLPGLVTAPGAVALGAVVAAVSAWLHGARARRERSRTASRADRRFESAALRAAAPHLVAYIALLAVAPPGPALSTADAQLAMLRDVEWLGAFTLLGYALAEADGRAERRYHEAVVHVGAGATLTALGATALSLLAGVSVPSLPLFLALVPAAAYGGWVYHLQRAYVRALRGRR